MTIQLETRVCNKCNTEQPIAAFRNTNQNRHNGAETRPTCKTCRAEYQRDWAKQRNPASVRDSQLKYHYGISLMDCVAILEKQNGGCAICERKLDMGGDKESTPHVDHDHETAAVRGLLCHHCNVGLGHFSDNLVLLQKAARYLQEKQDYSMVLIDKVDAMLAELKEA